MKKLKQKASFLTKILLVVGLLISNLSSLSVVFAYEGEVAEDVIIELENNILEINYTEELAEDVKAVEVRVYENYTYLNELPEKEDGFSKVYSLTVEELEKAALGELELVHDSIFVHGEEEKKNFELFDGTYTARVQIVDTTVYPEEAVAETDEEVILAEGEFEKEFAYESGLNVKVFDSNGTLISLVDGNYPVTVDNAKIKIVAQILSGGLNPDDMFEIDGEEFFARDLLAHEFNADEDFTGMLFGNYEVPVSVSVKKTDVEEEVVYDETINVLYENYEKNAELLNEVSSTLGYDEVYLFNSDSKNGMIYVIPSFETVSLEETVVTRTMLDLYTILEEKYGSEEIVSYTMLKNGINVLESYDENSEVSLEEYLATISVDETVEIVLSNKGLTLTFGVSFVADINNDTVITEDDVLELIDQVLSEEEVDLENSDIYGEDDEVNSLDVLYLNQVLKTNIWEVQIDEYEAILDARLDVKFNEEALSEENYLVSGDEFTVDYVLSLKDYEVNGVAGTFNYDEELFELVSLEVNNEWIGNHKDSKFLYLGEESLLNNSEELSTEYIILTATFKTLVATNEESNNVITLDEIELFNSTDNGVVYYLLDNNTISTDEILVKASDDNTLTYLEVAGVEIELQDDVYNYEITVSNDVTATDLKYILSNMAANVSLTNVPEELVEGENEIVITVTSESGISQEYVIKVVREELVIEEETTTQVNYTNDYSDDEGNQEEEIITTNPVEEDEDDDYVEEEEEENNLSRIVIIILILLVIAGLVYLIFKDEDDEETKKANKEVNKLKKENIEPEVIKNTNNKQVNNKGNNNKKNSNNKNNKKER